jgi:hypothetical protein
MIKLLRPNYDHYWFVSQSVIAAEAGCYTIQITLC